ncbi:hypothetical protein AMTR_s00129p00006940 [Amborella trichopoda]|uniref:CCT-eta n=1 Tax=Amborella trichopoda TaxID=13333 RepID=W1NKD3_AMBTC|nr:hypothetical protein AMTR_s00129p00006940 [Amborella trichopoda]
MDKLIHDDKANTTISNDRATIMKLLDIVHPSAKTLVAIANSQDSEVGDGTTTVVLLAGEFLKEAKPFIEDGELAVSIEGRSFKEKKDLMQKCAATTLSSTLIGGEKEFFASMVVDAEMAIGEDDRLNLIGVKKFLAQYQSIVDAEWTIIYDKLDKCVKSGAKIVLSRLAIGDLATQYFSYRDIFVLLFEEKQVGNERFNIFSGCPTSGQTTTILLRGGADQFIEEAERSLHYAIMIVRTALRTSTVVADGGAIDVEISRYLRQHARTIVRKSQLFINSYAKALEIIPRQLCDKAGFDATDALNKLRQKHPLPSGEGARYGVDINTGGITYTFANFVWEPAVVKINAINAAIEAACLVLSVDETVRNPKSESAQGEAAASAMGRGRGGGPALLEGHAPPVNFNV